MNYGSMDDETGFGDADHRQDPLLPPREASTAESRRLRKRVSRRAYWAGSKEGEAKPVMKSLYGNKRKSQRRPTVPMNIETLQGLVPKAAQETNNGQPLQYQQQQPAPPRPKKKHGHSWLYILLHPHSSHPHAIIYKWFISIIILVDVAFFVASTEETWRQAHPTLFYYEEGLVSSIFLVEYICRLYVAPESHKYAHLNPWVARWQYMGTVSALMDAASALPFFLELPTGLKLPNLTWIRLFRLLRILKTESYARSMETVWRVIYYNREILYVALNMCILLVLVTAVLMYYFRPQDDPEDTSDFSSLMATMYLSTLMLTGQGGPEGDLPWYTKMVVLVTGFFSVAMFAIPASMLTWGFEAEAERCARKARRKYLVKAKEETNNPQEDDGDSYSKYVSSSSSSEGDTTDEEYLNIIAGGDDDEEGDGKHNQPEDQVVKQLIRTFQTSDVDASGSLSMDEFIELMTDPSLSSMGMVGMATSMGLLAKRVHHLENELAESHRKLDQILQVVNQKRE